MIQAQKESTQTVLNAFQMEDSGFSRLSNFIGVIVILEEVNNLFSPIWLTLGA